MNKELKKHIHLLAERFEHEIEYQKYVLVLKSEVNEIRLWEEDKYGMNISYNLNEGMVKNLKSDLYNIYDILIQLFTRSRQEQQVEIKTGFLFTLEAWVEEEGEWVLKEIKSLKDDLKKENIECREFGGNRCLAQYYKGIFILIDDLCYFKSNVFPID